MEREREMGKGKGKGKGKGEWLNKEKGWFKSVRYLSIASHVEKKKKITFKKLN